MGSAERDAPDLWPLSGGFSGGVGTTDFTTGTQTQGTGEQRAVLIWSDVGFTNGTGYNTGTFNGYTWDATSVFYPTFTTHEAVELWLNPGAQNPFNAIWLNIMYDNRNQDSACARLGSMG